MNPTIADRLAELEAEARDAKAIRFAVDVKHAAYKTCTCGRITLEVPCRKCLKGEKKP